MRDRETSRGRAPGGRWTSRGAVVLVALALLVPGRASSAHSPGDASPAARDALRPEGRAEYEVKAAFLFNFALFTEWPADAFESKDAPLVVAVVGEDPFGKALDRALKGKKVGGRALRLERYEDAEHLGKCHMLFVPAGEVGHMKAILGACEKRPVLLVGESADFAVKGGAFSFYIEERRVRFEINPRAAERRELKVSSKLLKLARIVKEERP